MPHATATAPIAALTVVFTMAAATSTTILTTSSRTTIATPVTATSALRAALPTTSPVTTATISAVACAPAGVALVAGGVFAVTPRGLLAAATRVTLRSVSERTLLTDSFVHS